MFPRQQLFADFYLLVMHGQLDSRQRRHRLHQQQQNTLLTMDTKLNFFSPSSKAATAGTPCCLPLAVWRSGGRDCSLYRRFLLPLTSQGRRCSQHPPRDENLIKCRSRGHRIGGYFLKQHQQQSSLSLCLSPPYPDLRACPR